MFYRRGASAWRPCVGGGGGGRCPWGPAGPERREQIVGSEGGGLSDQPPSQQESRAHSGNPGPVSNNTSL